MGKEGSGAGLPYLRPGKDIEIDDPFAPGDATEKPIRYLGRVPGSPERAATRYDVSQAFRLWRRIGKPVKTGHKQHVALLKRR